MMEFKCEICGKKFDILKHDILGRSQGSHTCAGNYCNNELCDKKFHENHFNYRDDDILVLYDRYNYAVRSCALKERKEKMPIITQWDSSQTIARHRKDFDISKHNRKVAATI